MAEVFAGFVAGYALAVLSTPLLALTLLRLRTGSEVLARLFPAGVSMVSVGVLVHGALFFFWTGLGIVLGLILLGMRDAGSALGSANAPFTLFVAALTLALAAPVAIVIRPLRQPVVLCSLLVLAVFGWLMPYLAQWSTFES